MCWCDGASLTALSGTYTEHETPAAIYSFWSCKGHNVYSSSPNIIILHRRLDHSELAPPQVADAWGRRSGWLTGALRCVNCLGA
jgi:hypothetical protein